MVLSYQRLKLLISVVICNTSSFCHLELVFSSWEGLLFSLFQFLQDHEGFLIFLESVLIKAGFLIISRFHLIAQIYLVSLCHLLTLEEVSMSFVVSVFPTGSFLEQPQHFKSFSLNPFFIYSVSYCMHITVLEFSRYLCWFK